MNTTSDLPEDDDLVDIEDAARLCGLPVETILEYSRMQVVTITRGSGNGVPSLDAECLHRLRRIEALHQELELPPRGVRLVMDLMDRLDAAERELRMMKERLR